MKAKYVGLAAIAAVLLGAWATGTMSALIAMLVAVPVVFGMILDERGEFCDATSVVNATGLLLIGDVIDLSVARNISSPPRPMFLVIQVATGILAAGGASEVQFSLASDAQAAIAVDGSATIHWQSAAIPKATLVAGYTLVVPLPGEGPHYERYLGILVNITTFAVTTGAINAFLTHDPKQWEAQSDGV